MLFVKYIVYVCINTYNFSRDFSSSLAIEMYGRHAMFLLLTCTLFIYYIVNIDQNQIKLVLINITYRKKYSTILFDLIS